MHRVTEYRVGLSLTMSAVVGTLGLHAYPLPGDLAVLALIHVVHPALYAGFTYATPRCGLRRPSSWPASGCPSS